MRYFFIGYSYKFGFGSSVIESSNFPSLQFIQESIKDVQNVVPISIFEFKNKEDRDDYVKDMPKETRFK